MKVQVLPDAESVAIRGAAFIAAAARQAVSVRGAFTMAVSGGHTPWQMLSALAAEEVPWGSLQILQVDERIAPAGDPDRNLTHLRDSLLTRAPIKPEQIYPMPVEEADVEKGAMRYAAILKQLAGNPAILDLIHLGLGPDGHTASLVPNDPVLEVADRDVAITGVYQNRRRMTVTYPTLNRARQILWVITGADKVEALARLRRGDVSIPAGRVNNANMLVLADGAAAGSAT
jgi:6-phosphogluconolactonase